MNREVLGGMLVGEGHSYANDALQTICAKIYGYSNHEMLKLQQEIEDLAWLQEKVKDIELLSESDQVKYLHLADAQHQTIKLFDKIVSHGPEFSIQFIEANTWAWKN